MRPISHREETLDYVRRSGLQAGAQPSRQLTQRARCPNLLTATASASAMGSATTSADFRGSTSIHSNRFPMISCSTISRSSFSSHGGSKPISSRTSGRSTGAGYARNACSSMSRTPFEVLHLSEHEAYERMTAARASQKYPMSARGARFDLATSELRHAEVRSHTRRHSGLT